MATTRENKTISQFKSQLIGGGARPNLFEVELTTLPAGIAWPADNFRYMCKAAQLPASVIANIDIPFRGRIFKVAGDRTIEPWSITIINDEDFKYRSAFEGWMQHILRLENNTGTTSPQEYMTNADVIQLGRGEQKGSKNSIEGSYDGSATGVTVAGLARYQMQDIWPVNVSSIDLSMDNSDQIEEFTVEFAVQSFSRMASVDT